MLVISPPLISPLQLTHTHTHTHTSTHAHKHTRTHTSKPIESWLGCVAWRYFLCSRKHQMPIQLLYNIYAPNTCVYFILNFSHLGWCISSLHRRYCLPRSLSLSDCQELETYYNLLFPSVSRPKPPSFKNILPPPLAPRCPLRNVFQVLSLGLVPSCV